MTQQNESIISAYKSGKTIASIIKETEMKHHWVKKILYEAGEPSRKIRLTRKTEMNQQQREIIDGLMLSDACIHRYYDAIMSTFDLQSRHYEFVEHIINKLLPMQCRIRHRQAQDRIIRGEAALFRETFGVISKPDLVLNEWRDKWYPVKRKIVPSDLIITPLVMKYWYYGDGWSSFGKYKDVPDAYVSAGFSTNSFTTGECEMLIEKIQQQTGLIFGIHYAKKGTQPTLNLAGTNSIHKFFDYIGECDLDCFKYKWKRPTDSKDGFMYRWDEKHLK